MKKNLLLFLSLSLVVGISSCENVVENSDRLKPAVNNQHEVQVIDEEKAIETFNNFISRLNDDTRTRSTTSAPKVISIRKTTTATYSGTPHTRSNSIALPVCELTLENTDKTQGFAVVTSAAAIDEVIAYSPQGSIADTVYNKALALYFRDLAILSDIVSSEAVTRADYWQPGWDDIVYKQVSSEEFVRWLTPWESENRPNKGFSWGYYDPIDKMEFESAYVPTLWAQENPYNNRVPKYVVGTKSKVVVGCYPVAVGQIMAFHKFPSTYNWSTLTMCPTIDPTPTVPGGGIDESKETFAQKEVSRLLTDIAIAAETYYDTLPNTRNFGSTQVGKTLLGLYKMGYDAKEVYFGGKGGSSALIKEEIQNYHRPVLYNGQTDKSKGHIWVIDAVLTQERWSYISYYVHGGENNGKEGLERYRVQGNLLHCNWGWGGSSNGWYYNFTPPHKGEFIHFYKDKHLYTGIKPM